jgi:acetolactate synthase-1/2/3 large subunit
VVTCRQEGGASMMAEAHGKLTGRPGICFVTRGPGATNASAGVHVAQQDGTPMILFVGQVKRSHRGRNCFQEFDLPNVFETMAKWAVDIDDPARIPELVGRAFDIAVNGRPGPVVIGIPEDMLAEDVAPPAARRVSPKVKAAPIELANAKALAIGEALAAAKNPLVIVGGGGWSAEASRSLATFARDWNLPVAVSFRCQDYLDNHDPHFAGTLGLGANPRLVAAARESDFILAVGGGLDDISTNGFTLFDVPEPSQKIAWIGPDGNEIGHVYRVWMECLDDATSATRRLSQMAAPRAPAWAERTKALRDSYTAWIAGPKIEGPLQLGAIMERLRAEVPADTVVTNGAGNFSMWPNRFYSYRGFGTMLAPRSGSMGYGLPAAVAAKVTQPEKTVVCFAGDGDLMMTVQELATAAMHDAPIIVILVNNGMYGTIRMHQEMHFPARVSATALKNPDFTALARSFGFEAEKVTTTEEFWPAFERARKSRTGALLELILTQEQLSPTMTITKLRAQAKG